MFRRLMIAAALAAVAGHALAAGRPPAKAAASKVVGQYVDLQPVGLPIVVDSRLVNYVFVNVRLNLAANANTAKWREKEPFFRDALVRAAHRTPFTRLDDYQKIDADKLAAILMREAGAIAGEGVVRSAVVTSETSRYRVSTPRPAARSDARS
jgi:hypothetical protein